ncbi:radical SAM family heme chaperone HemW [Gracilibacillus salinarum]|uniref:Heme chaperone HemW n=1 Tax=Gracilibacillus salinarum TaxID=2932255 RepID=A0ABY4GPF1_9BACI|nr:radical SAM family heme chaperone HemW [Gracilibacillus salinarum]UOQ86056.1 radical SAM family heme chaperone HemW [Gracilibacillus salinarum]
MVSSAYIHIPFCEKICHYCDFTKFFYDEKMADDYLIALENEMKAYIHKPKKKMETIFVGGGTPTALNEKQLTKLVQIINHYFDVSTVSEYSFEANPGDLTNEKINILRAYGVNRISMGVQVLDNDMLEQLGRLHRVKDVYENVNGLIKAGIDNISIDLMYSLPNQSVEGFNQTLQEALQFHLPHYSAYSLQIEPKTIFYQRYMKGKLSKPPEEIEADMYALLRSEMRANGIHQYEISNFAKPGFESQHNLVYWNNQYYFGFGAGAHGYLPGERIINIRPFPKYVEAANNTGKPVLHIEHIGRKEQIEEEMFLGLRKSEGVSIDAFEQKYQIPLNDLYGEELRTLKQKGWIDITSSFVKLTEEGKPFGNEVFQSFLLDDNAV